MAIAETQRVEEDPPIPAVQPGVPKAGDETRITPTATDEVGRITPMMEQYIEIKTANPDCPLLYRMGDFYEAVFRRCRNSVSRPRHRLDQARQASRPRHSDVRRADRAVRRISASVDRAGPQSCGLEQLEDPVEARKRGAKNVARRDVVRLVTSGTLTDYLLLDAKRNNFLLAIARSRTSATEDRFALAWIDISTSEFNVAECERAALAAAVARIEPGESIVADAVYSDTELSPYLRSLPAVTPLTRDVFDGATAERRLAAFFGVATTASFGAFSRIELTAAAAAVTYVERTQIGKRPPLSPPVREAAGATLAIDQATRANLELIRTLSGERRGSLLAAIDRTVTAAGSRLLAQRLAAPLTDPNEIAHRLDAVSAFVNDSAMRSDLRGTLKTVPDLARALARIVIGRGGPRDLAAIRDGICAAVEFSARLSALAAVPRDIADAIAALRRPDAGIATELARALADELPAFRRDGGFVRNGYQAALDEARALRDEARRVIAALQVRYAETTGVKTLKIRHNNVLGYFVDVTAQHGEKLLTAPLNGTFIHRQTLAGQVRFTTTELGELEAKIANAADRALALELEIFDALAARVTAASAAIKQAAEALAAVDAMTALAALAIERNYVRPVVDGGLTFLIEGGRHPVVEQALGADGGPFVANDCDLSPPTDATAGRIWLVTGPNMAGKSTFLRQNALIAVLAQMGSFVPARAAHIGVVDRLFSRVGAADDLARGHSTFMVEMVETAAILNQAGERALVILDEIGRGTGDLRRPLHRLGDHRASARTQSLPHAVCHAFPRDDRARRQAQAAAQRHHAGEGMARRRGVPARSRARRRRPLLRHPGGEARRPAFDCHRARQAGAGPDRSRGSHLSGAQIDRRPAAVRRGAARTCDAAPRRGAHCFGRRARRAASRRNVAARRARSPLRAQGAAGEDEKGLTFRPGDCASERATA